MATTGKIVEVLFENALDTFEHQEMMLDKVDFFKPDPADMQNAGNVVWRPVDQHAPIISGWSVAGQEQEIIEETYPSILGTPKNDFVQQRADDLRDTRFWERRGRESGRQQATELNKQIASTMTTQGTMFYRSNATSGYDFIGEGQALMNERQGKHTQRCFLLNDRDNLTFAKDLAGRQTVQGRPEDVWGKGQIAGNVAEFDVYVGSFLPNLAGGADPAATVTGAQSFAPEGGSVNTATGVVTNVDYRYASIPVSDSSGYNVGDKVTFSNGGTAVKALGLADKTDTGQAMTFTIVGKPDGTTIEVYPKPIAFDDPALSTTEKQYANIDTQIGNLATVDRVNTDTSAKSNLFWDKDAVEVIGGTIPANLFKQFDGMKVISSTMKNGQEMYLVYDGNIETMNFRYRLFTWYGITVRDPSRVGVAVTF
ncbi:P22 phage major capsid protein family protein [Zhongshania sp.]|uniref:P22 phage major capsid protein family protein n=1 Tax=Zhongshania sp. TaxID=1971902 RepID=UPI00356A4F2B